MSSVQLLPSADGVCQLVLDVPDAPVNVFSFTLLDDLGKALASLREMPDVRGVIVRSAKSSFAVGADIVAFLPKFAEGPEAIVAFGSQVQSLFGELTELPFPSVCLIEGDCLGGGLELALACDYRVVSPTAMLGLPEVSLGILPGWGGTVRLPRMLGLDNALDMMLTGKAVPASDALGRGLVDAVVERDLLMQAANSLLAEPAAAKSAWRARREAKSSPLALPEVEQRMVFSARAPLAGKMAASGYPAAAAIVESVRRQVVLRADEALSVEAQAFAELATSPVATQLIRGFLQMQSLKRTAKRYGKTASDVKAVGVLGAGIMGAGVAGTSVLKGTPAVLLDLDETALDKGRAAVTGILQGRRKRGRLSDEAMLNALSTLSTTTDNTDLATTDLVVEAVTETLAVKQKVLELTESVMHEAAILTTNTSTISVDLLAEGLQRPSQFCGLHFFNPVDRMPLIEVVRGSQSSDATIATAVRYATSLGKTVIVVRDCAGFLVNRILFPYINAFNKLIAEGEDYRRIDRLMTRFGWPMGPAHLMDMVGMDTGVHAAKVMSGAYLPRMAKAECDANDTLFEAGRLGRKSGAGFFRYEKDKRGRWQPVDDPATDALLYPNGTPAQVFDDKTLTDRLLLPFCFEAVRCLEEKIADSAEAIDVAVRLGLGFPPFRGGPLAMLDEMGLQTAVERGRALRVEEPACEPPALLVSMAENGQLFFPLAEEA